VIEGDGRMEKRAREEVGRQAGCGRSTECLPAGVGYSIPMEVSAIYRPESRGGMELERRAVTLVSLRWCDRPS
jgi:hypothetical protein